MNLEKAKKIHFIGIGGIGVSAIAKLMLNKEKIVSGSDSAPSEITEEIEKKGGKIFFEHKESNLSDDADLVVFSPAAAEDNPELKKAKKLNIPALSYPQFLGILSKDHWTITVSGTHGKSTATSLLSLILEQDNFDPTVIVGSKIKSFPDENLRIGKSKYFVVEACEYKESMLNLFPQMIVLTNIEADHLDYYKDLNHIKNTFKKYIELLPENGVLIYNADDENCADAASRHSELAKNPDVSAKKRRDSSLPFRMTFGIKNSADVMATNIRIENHQQVFSLKYKNKKLGEISLNIPGMFNIYNALAAIAAALALEASFDNIKKALADFTGIWRRYEYIGEYNGAKIISDYAHHPTAVEETIKATRDFFPNQRIITVFQPHSWNRTKKLFSQFADSFDDADIVILSEVYQVSGRENLNDKISSQELAAAIKRKGKKNVFYAQTPQKALQIALNHLQSNDILLVMGAGDIYKITSHFNGSKQPNSAIEIK